MTDAPGTQKVGIGTNELDNIATLARLRLAPGQHADLSREFTAILGYVDMLNSVNTDTVEPLYSPCVHASPVREDQAHATISRQELFANAPESDGEFFIVPKIV